jgi:hypothetical protein
MRIDKEKKIDLEQEQILALFQEVKPEHLELEGLQAPYRLYRYDKGDSRFYYRLNKSNQGSELTPYLSVTSFTGKSLPTSPYLIEWIGNLGNDTADYQKNLKAEYGTILHIEIARAVRQNGYSFKDLENRLMGMIEQRYRYLYANWLYSLKRDLMSFFAFFKERIVKVIGLEVPVYSDTYGLGGVTDMPCIVEFNGKHVNSIVDFKSGRKGFWQSHELQLHCYKEIWNERFGDLFEVTHVFNWSPNDWKKKPTYKFKNQTDSIFASSTNIRMSLALLEGWIIPPIKHYDIVGEVQELKSFDFDKHILKDTRVKEALINH